MSTGSTGSFIPKWQMAILLGAPIAIGLGYLYYRSQATRLTEDATDSTDKKKIGKSKDKSISLDGDDKLLLNGRDATQSILNEAIRHKNEGNQHFRKGKFNEAIKSYDKAIETCPESKPQDLATFYQNRAAAYEQLSKWSKVKEDCTAALALHPRYIKAYFRRAKVHEMADDLIASLEDITATCILEGFQNSSSLVFADRVLKELGRRDAKEAFAKRQVIVPSTNFLKAYFASYTKDPVTQIQLDDDDELSNGFGRAQKAVNDGDFSVVIPACIEEIESNGKHKLVATLLCGTMYLVAGALNEAFKDFNAIIDDPKAPTELKVNALIKRASLHVQNEDHQRCFEDFADAEKLDAKNADIYHQRGQVYVLLEKLDEASSDFVQATELAPDFAGSHVQKCYVDYRHAVLLQNQLQIYQSIQAANRIADKFPCNVEVCNILAQILTEQQQFDKADELFTKAIRLQPKHAALYVHRGLLHLQWNGEIDKALEYMNKAIEVDDKCELAYETLGTIQVQRGHLHEAIELFEKALKLCRSEAEMVHIYSLRNAAIAQLNVAQKLNLDLSVLTSGASIDPLLMR